MITIRTATRHDLEAIREILNDAIVNTQYVYDQTPKSSMQMIEWFENKNQNHYPILVTCEQEHVIGYATYMQFRPWEGFRNAIEHSFYVHPAHRGKSVGSSLLIAILNEAKQRGKTNAIAGIDSTNETSLRMHLKHGFTTVGTFPKIGLKKGMELDLIMLQKRLT